MKPMQPTLFDQGTETLTVHALTVRIKQLLEAKFLQVCVVGEISSYKPAASGHHYFCLKDRFASLRCVLWRSNAARSRCPLKDGMEVVIRGRLDVYPPRGEYQLDVLHIEPKGQGAQDQALRVLKEKLQGLGYFARERKRPIPRFPRRLALVTSPHSAAIRDMLEILGRRWPLAEVLVCPVRVQGTGAGLEISQTLTRLNRIPLIDTILLGRGGGSSDDLAAFNEEVVARAIFNSRAPVVSAVGHEIDVTIADLVADQRALTPSEAAELVTTPCLQDVLRHLAQSRSRLCDIQQSRLQSLRKHLQTLATRRVLREPRARLRELERKWEETGERLQRALSRRLEHCRTDVVAAAARLSALSPLNVLTRGYSLIQSGDGTLVRSIQQVQGGDEIVIQLADGRLVSRVEEILPPDPRWRGES